MAIQRDFYHIEGLKELDKALEELPKATAKNVLLRTLKIEGEPIRQTASELAPDDPKTSGKDLHSSIVTATTPSRNRDSDVEVSIGPSRKTFWGLFQEFGTSHSGAQPFMRPAFDSKVMQVLSGIRDRLADEIEKARKRLARKAERDAALMK